MRLHFITHAIERRSRNTFLPLRQSQHSSRADKAFSAILTFVCMANAKISEKTGRLINFRWMVFLTVWIHAEYRASLFKSCPWVAWLPQATVSKKRRHWQKYKWEGRKRGRLFDIDITHQQRTPKFETISKHSNSFWFTLVFIWFPAKINSVGATNHAPTSPGMENF